MLGLGIGIWPGAVGGAEPLPQLASLLMHLDPTHGRSESGGVIDSWAAKVGAATFTAAGAARPLGGGVWPDFQGVDDAMTATSDAVTHPVNATKCSILAWVYQDATSDATIYISATYPNGITLITTAGVRFDAYFGALFVGGSSGVTADQQPAANEWRCVVATFDGAQSAGSRAKIYIGPGHDLTDVTNDAVNATALGAAAGSAVLGGSAARWTDGLHGGVCLWGGVALTLAEAEVAARLTAPVFDNVNCDGNSLTVFGGSNSYPSQLFAGMTARGRVVKNHGVGGQTTNDMISLYPTKIAPRFVAGARNKLVAWEVRNAMHLGGKTPRQAVDDLWTYVGLAKATGWQVYVCTVIASVASAPNLTDAKIAEANGYIRAEAAAQGVTVIDLAADARLSDDTNTTYFDGDQVHLTTAGYGVVAALVKTALGY